MTERMRFTLRGPARLAGVMLAFLGLVVIAGPVLWPESPVRPDFAHRYAAFSPEHPLGTDQIGRDMLARMIAGGRATLAVGVLTALLASGFGIILGLVAGMKQRIDGALMRVTDLFLAIPLLPLALVAAALFREPAERSFGPVAGAYLLVIGAISLTSWMMVARLMRAEARSLRGRNYILAAEALGASAFRIAWFHILPNAAAPLLSATALTTAHAILAESALSYLGYGFPPDTPTWGRMLFDAEPYIQVRPSLLFLPGAAIFLTVLCVFYLAEGLRDALDPRFRL